MPSEAYGLIWRATRERLLITCLYQTFSREACPIILGYKNDGREVVFTFQVGGKSSGKLPRGGAWRCLYLAEVRDLAVRAGDWREGERHSTTQHCVDWVDVDVNIPETLTRSAPLPFGSPELRPPRGSGRSRS